MEQDVVKIPIPHDHKHGNHNPDACAECARIRIAQADKRGETPDMHDLMILKDHYGGYW